VGSVRILAWRLWRTLRWPEGWAAAADGYARPDVSSPALLLEYKKVLAEYTARTQRPLNHVRDFLDCIRSRRSPVANPEVMYGP
jgi:hypothetical protein